MGHDPEIDGPRYMPTCPPKLCVLFQHLNIVHTEASLHNYQAGRNLHSQGTVTANKNWYLHSILDPPLAG